MFFCDVCIATFKHAARNRASDEPFFQSIHHANHASFVASANANCNVCAELIARVDDFDISFPKERGTCFSTLHSGLSINITIGMAGGARRVVPLQILPASGLDVQSPLVSADFSDPAAIPEETGDDHITDLILGMLRVCLSSHLNCLPHEENSWLPTRLLDISSSETDSTVRLVTTSEVAKIRYATLTHRWGASDEQVLKLKHSTIGKLYNGIDVDALPKTYRHAVKVTERLGLRYLWIDSLCIIQDDLEDWQKESAIMGLIYQSGTINISAIAAQDATSGFFVSRDTSQITPFVFTEEEHSWAVISADFWKENIEESHLSRRGWIFQERIMAPRSIYYTGSQVFWECRTIQACETFPKGFPSPLGGSAWGNGRVLKKACTGRSLVQSEIAHLPLVDDAFSYFNYKYWSDIVTAYSQCHLTFKRDKLMALSGLARSAHSMLQTEYLAGLWENQLPHALLWFAASKFASHSLGIEPYIAPSWSWVSFPGSVHLPPNVYALELHGDRTGDCLTISNASISLINTMDPFGQIEAGYLRMRGPVFSVHCFTDSFRPDPRVSSEKIRFSNYIPAGQDPEIAAAECFELFFRHPTDAVQSVTAHLDEGGWSDFFPPCCFLPVYVNIEKQPAALQGLLISQTPRGQFFRIGLLSIYGALPALEAILLSVAEVEITII